MPEQIVILDFGAQYAQVIARRVRECGVFSVVLPFDTPMAEIAGIAAQRPDFFRRPYRASMRPRLRSPTRASSELGAPILPESATACN